MLVWSQLQSTIIVASFPSIHYLLCILKFINLVSCIDYAKPDSSQSTLPIIHSLSHASILFIHVREVLAGGGRRSMATNHAQIGSVHMFPLTGASGTHVHPCDHWVLAHTANNYCHHPIIKRFKFVFYNCLQNRYWQLVQIINFKFCKINQVYVSWCEYSYY